MARTSLCSRIVQVARRTHGVEVRTNKHSILPSPGVSEVADAVKFLVHFHWPASLSPSYASRTLCMMLPQLHHSPSCSGTQWLESGEGIVNDGDTLDWQNIRSEVRRSWRESGVTPRELLRLIQTMKQGGLTPTRNEYSRMLQVCLCLSEHEVSTVAGLHSTVREIVTRMKDDLGTTTASSVLMSSVLPLSSSQGQAQRIWKNLVEVTGTKSKELSVYLLEAYLLDKASKPAVFTLNKQLVANKVPLSAHTLERVLLLCIKQYKLSQAIGTYTSMTRRYGIAPSKEAYTKFTRLLAATSQSDLMSEKLCYRILADTKAVFGGSPPLWIYTLMSKPLLRLKGLQGYRDMYQVSSTAALELSQLYSSEAKALIQQSWEPSVYNSLIYRCSHFLDNGASMALQLYREMVVQGGSSTEKTFELLLRVAHNRNDLSSYITPLLYEITSLSKERIVQLRDPVVQALARIYDYHTVGLTHHPSTGWHSVRDQDTPKFISLAGQLLVCETLSLAESHQHCLDQLANINSHNTLNSHAHILASNTTLSSNDQQVLVVI